MLLTLLFVVLVYLFAVESFTAFLYPDPKKSHLYFQAADLPDWLFEAIIVLSDPDDDFRLVVPLHARARPLGLDAALGRRVEESALRPVHESVVCGRAVSATRTGGDARRAPNR